MANDARSTGPDMSKQPRKRASETRTETDTFGPIEVPVESLWGAQTERSRHNFRIGGDPMPTPLIRALGVVKRAAADVNNSLGSLDRRRAGVRR